MKSNNSIHHVLRAIALLTVVVGIQSVHAQGTAFTYQGRLTSSNAPFDGSAEFQFILWDSASGGNAVATNNPASVIATVTGGLFTVTLDFGVNAFDGSPRFLETGVRTVIGPFTTLTPRQPITATPYALRALNLTSNGLAGTYGNAVTFGNAGNSFAGTFTGSVSGAVSGDGSGLANVNAATVGGLSSGSFWNTSGNAGANPTNGAFLGTTDNLPLEFKVNGQRAMRLEPTTSFPNVIGGFASNAVDAGIVGATISGGGTTGGVGLGPNHISENLATIGGGSQNTNQGRFGTIGGGGGNTISVDTLSFATIAGGNANKIQSGAENSAISGGQNNNIGPTSPNSVIGGGSANTVAAGTSGTTISGGSDNTVQPDGGGSVIGGGDANFIGGTPTGGNLSLGGCNTISGGVENNIRTNADFGTISGGEQNTIGTNADFVTIAGGELNNVSTSSSESVISGGGGNSIGTNSFDSVIGGGNSNTVPNNAAFAIIPGGDSNSATNYGFAAGRRAKANHIGAFVWGDSNNADVVSTSANSVAMRASGGYRLFSTNGTTAGVSLAPGGTAWAVISDRNVKKDFAAVDCREILEKLAAMPITQWHYQWEEPEVTPHIGPMAQDFKAAFYPGTDDKSITTQESDGVELAAIQGLNQKLEEQRAENAELKQRLEKLERLMNQRSVEPK